MSDATTWVAVGLAIGAVCVALLALAVGFVATRGRRRALAEQVALESRVGELEQALILAREEGSRERLFGGIRESLDIESVVERTLDAAAAVAGVDVGLVMLPPGEPGDAARPFVASIGLAEDELPVYPLPGPPDGRPTRSVALDYRYDEADAEGAIRGGIAVVLMGEEHEPIGTLGVFWRGAAEPEVGLVEELARTAGPAIGNARRFSQARQLADLDALTALHNRRFFHETLEREVVRAQRYGRRLALLILDVDDFKTLNDRAGHLAGDVLLSEIGDRVRSVVRAADVACRVGGDEFAVILPESTSGDAELLYRRLQLAVAARPPAPSDRLHLSAGIAELDPHDTAVTLFERADEALYRAKHAGKGRVILTGQAS